MEVKTIVLILLPAVLGWTAIIVFNHMLAMKKIRRRFYRSCAVMEFIKLVDKLLPGAYEKLPPFKEMVEDEEERPLYKYLEFLIDKSETKDPGPRV